MLHIRSEPVKSILNHIQPCFYQPSSDRHLSLERQVYEYISETVIVLKYSFAVK